MILAVKGVRPQPTVVGKLESG